MVGWFAGIGTCAPMLVAIVEDTRFAVPPEDPVEVIVVAPRAIVDLDHLPFRTAGEALVALVGGTVDAGGTLRGSGGTPLVVVDGAVLRSPSFPDPLLPTSTPGVRRTRW